MMDEIAPHYAKTAREAEAERKQFELLRDYLLREYAQTNHIEGWKLSDMKRPSRATVERLVDWFLHEN